MERNNYIADSLAFFDLQLKPQLALEGLATCVDLIHTTVVPPNLTKGLDIRHAALKCIAFLHGQSHLRLVTKATQLESDGERVAFLAGLQEAPHNPTEELLHYLWSVGVRVMPISYKLSSHPLGGGFEDNAVGLTERGVEYLRTLAKVGFILDLSHSSHQTARDALLMIKEEGLTLPVMASHGGCYAVYRHNRNLPDDVLRQIFELEGLVGLYTLTFGLHESDNGTHPFINHLDRLVGLGGSGKISIGSDGAYSNHSDLEWKEHYDKLSLLLGGNESKSPFHPRFPDTIPIFKGPDRINKICTVLRDDGLSEPMLAGIAGENFRTFLKRSLPTT